MSKMKNSSSALQQATGPVGHKTQDQATQTTFEIPSPSKLSRGSPVFLKNEVLRIPFDFPPSPTQNYVIIASLSGSGLGGYFCLGICLRWKIWIMGIMVQYCNNTF